MTTRWHEQGHITTVERLPSGWYAWRTLGPPADRYRSQSTALRVVAYGTAPDLQEAIRLADWAGR